MQGDNPFDGAEVISEYSRQQAIEDGILVDVTEIGRALFVDVRQICVTRSVWSLVEAEAAKRTRMAEARGKRRVNYESTITKAMLNRISGHHTVRCGMQGKREDLIKTRAFIGDVTPEVFLSWNDYEGVTIMLPEDY